jgi:hypothetical protein
MKTMLVVAALASIAVPASGQETVGGAPDMDDLIVQAGQTDSTQVSVGSPILPRVWCGEIGDSLTRTQCWTSYRASLQYYETGLAHRARVFAWQHVSTRIIFFVVLVLVAVGVYFAWVQFQRDMAKDPGPGGVGTEVRDAPAEHEVELSMKGIRVSSPVIGIAILAISLAFFYLYLVYVYPITEIF